MDALKWLESLPLEYKKNFGKIYKVTFLLQLNTHVEDVRRYLSFFCQWGYCFDLTIISDFLLSGTFHIRSSNRSSEHSICYKFTDPNDWESLVWHLAYFWRVTIEVQTPWLLSWEKLIPKDGSDDCQSDYCALAERRMQAQPGLPKRFIGYSELPWILPGEGVIPAYGPPPIPPAPTPPKLKFF